MRLVHETDATGRLTPVLDPAAATALWELWAPRRRALVVHPDVLRRIQLRRTLTGEGYEVAVCAGPDQVQCPALAGRGGLPPVPRRGGPGGHGRGADPHVAARHLRGLGA